MMMKFNGGGNKVYKILKARSSVKIWD